MQGSNAKSFVGSSGGNAGRELDLQELDLEELKESYDHDLTRVGDGMGCQNDFKELDFVDLKDLDLDDLEKLDQGWRWRGLPSNLEPLFASLFPDPPLVSKFESCKVFFFFSLFPDPPLIRKFGSCEFCFFFSSFSFSSFHASY